MTRWALIALAALFSTIHPARSQEQQQFDSWLVLVVDVSGSVTEKEYQVQQNGYVQVLLDPMIGQALDRTAIAVVEFASTAVVAVAWTDVRGAGAAYRQWERQFQGSTCVFCGLELAVQLLDGKTGKRVIDISGDGVENVKDPDLVLDLRDLATAQEIQINTLALLVERQYGFTGSYTGPGGTLSTDDLERWYAKVATGFAMAIATLDDLADALKRKLFAEIATIEPYAR